MQDFWVNTPWVYACKNGQITDDAADDDDNADAADHDYDNGYDDHNADAADHD